MSSLLQEFCPVLDIFIATRFEVIIAVITELAVQPHKQGPLSGMGEAGWHFFCIHHCTHADSTGDQREENGEQLVSIRSRIVIGQVLVSESSLEQTYLSRTPRKGA